MKRGFTLIELLAVIVILAIISVIAVPIVLNIINNSKENANKRSIDMYKKSLENAIADYYLKVSSPENLVGEYTTESLEALLLENGVKVEYDGGKIKCETIIINENKTINLSNCTICENDSICKNNSISTSDESEFENTYQRVEWISATGTQYIDTTYHININTKVEYKAVRLGNESGEALHFGHYDSTNGNVWIEWYDNSLYYNFGCNNWKKVSFKPELNRFYVTEISANGLYVDRTKLANLTISKSLLYDNSAYIFAANNGSMHLPTRGLGIQYLSFSENGELKRNFVACYRKSDGVIGMYDTVKNEFFTNAGTGTFLKGDDVYSTQELEDNENYFDKFVVVDYLESNGNQYIDTEYKPNNNTRVICEFLYNSATSNDAAIYGYYTGSTTGPNFSSNIHSRGNWRYGNQNVQAGSILNQSKYQNSIVTSDVDKNGVRFNNELVGTYGSDTFQSDYSMYMFATNQNGIATFKYSGRIYSMKIYESEQLVRDFVPCYRKYDGKPGMYDLVNDVFYVNLGSNGDFVIDKETE